MIFPSRFSRLSGARDPLLWSHARGTRLASLEATATAQSGSSGPDRVFRFYGCGGSLSGGFLDNLEGEFIEVSGAFWVLASTVSHAPMVTRAGPLAEAGPFPATSLPCGVGLRSRRGPGVASLG